MSGGSTCSRLSLPSKYEKFNTVCFVNDKRTVAAGRQCALRIFRRCQQLRNGSSLATPFVGEVGFKPRHALRNTKVFPIDRVGHSAQLS